MQEHEFDNKDCLGLHFKDSDGKYVGVIKRIEARTCMLEGGMTVSRYLVSPVEYGDDDWYDFKSINFVTNGDYIRSKKNSGLWWITHHVEIGMDSKTAMFTLKDGTDFVVDDLEKWLCLAYKGDFTIENRPEPSFDDWASQNDPARRQR